MRKQKCLGTGLLALALVGLVGTGATAADTVEPFALGASDFELYTGVDGLGLPKGEKTVFGDVLLGYGVLERLSCHFGATVDANEYLAEGGADVRLGVHGNPVDTAHFDFDVFLDISGGRQFTAIPAFELNLDSNPEMTGFGMYIRGGIPIYGRDIAAPQAVTPRYELVAELEGVLGLYATLGRHQLLVELDGVLRPKALADEVRTELGGVALGYNVMLTENLELINQVYLDIPQREEPWAAGVSTGFIATLPGGV